MWARCGYDRCSDQFEYYVSFDVVKREDTAGQPPAWEVLDNDNKKSENHAQLDLVIRPWP